MATMTYVPSRLGEGFFIDVPIPGSGDDGKALVYDHGTGEFVYAAFDAAGTAAAAVAAHVALSDPHTQYELESANTAAAILTKLLTVDGAGSGLDADLLDGQSSAAFLLATGVTTGATSSRQAFTAGISAGSVAAGLSDTFGAKGFFYGPYSDDTTHTNLVSDASVTTTGDSGNALIAFSFTGTKFGAHNYGAVYGMTGNVYHEGSAGALSSMIAMNSNIGLIGASSAGSVGAGFYFMAGTPTRAGGSTTTLGALYGLFINNLGQSWIGGSYGIYVAHQTGASFSAAMLVEGGLIVFNENGDAASDFRAEGDTDQNLLFVDASADAVGIGTASPSNKLDVAGTIQADGLRLDVTPTSETITPTHTITFSANGTNYKIPCVAA